MHSTAVLLHSTPGIHPYTLALLHSTGRMVVGCDEYHFFSLLFFLLFAGSPFKPYIVDPSRVRVTGGWAPQVNDKGFIPLHVNKEKLLPFDASDAGLGRRRWHSSHRTRTVHHAEEFIPLISTVALASLVLCS